MEYSARCATEDVPIVAALFGQSADTANPGVRGVIVPLDQLPEARRKYGKFPCRFLLQGYEEHVEIRDGRPERWIHVPEEYYVWQMGVFLDTTREKGEELWSYGIFKPRVIAVRETYGDYEASAPREAAWLDYQEDEKVTRRREAIEKQRTEPKPVRQSAPRAAPRPAEDASGGGSGGTAVTKMTAEERAAYKARLLAKPVLTDRDKRHLARIERLEA